MFDAVGFPVYILIFFLIGTLATVFWIWMLIDCATKEPSQGNDKVVWIIIIVFTQIIGALIYYFVRRPKRKAEFGD
ncbi:PLDc N-terminal domain-containing protein [Methanohalobium sp.]|uniref:PLDc N-terminal domain-containing protein n=1 Tax=Methanohalobium sp. TaxID=2837493 RepID=UPI0025FB08E5|nr:PLDc N-terminal domain-containing protein [Methanohalobium sp.]